MVFFPSNNSNLNVFNLDVDKKLRTKGIYSILRILCCNKNFDCPKQKNC